MKKQGEEPESLHDIAGYMELSYPGRQYIIWLFDDHTEHHGRLIDTPVNFAASEGIGGEIRAQNLMRAKLEKWSK